MSVLGKLVTVLLVISVTFSMCYVMLQVVLYAMLAELMRPAPGIGELFAFRTWEWLLGKPQQDDDRFGLVAPLWYGAIYAGGQEALPYGWPAAYVRITQGCRPGHMALDLSNYAGTPVRATMHGTVVYAGWSSVGYGNLTIIRSSTPNGVYETYYAHLRAIDVAPGQVVARGQPIGEMGSTGRSTGPHLHYEVRINGRLWCPTISLPAQ